MERIESGTWALFGEEASIAASALFNSNASLTTPFGPENASMLVLNHSNQLGLLLQEFLLLRDGWRVEIWSWDGVRKSFKCSKRASPGNLEAVEELLMISESTTVDILSSQSHEMAATSSQAVSPVIAAVFIGVNDKSDTEVSISWCDLSSMRIGFLSFQDNSLLTTLESALIQLGVRELLIPQSGENYEKVKQIAAACQIVLQSLKSGEFFSCEDSKGMEEDLSRLVGEDRIRIAELTVSLTKTMRCLFVYLNLLGIDSNIGAFKLVNHNLKDFARLDEAALTSLNIFPKSSTSANGSSFSLFGLLDHCKTATGSRTLNQWLRQPLTNKTLIENRLDLVEMFVECPDGRHRLRENVLRGIPDITKLLKKLLRARSSLQVQGAHLYLFILILFVGNRSIVPISC
jgi:DNA mismatch repair protein MSH2